MLTTALSGVVALEVTGHVPLHHAVPPAPPGRSPGEGPVLTPLRPPILEDIDDMLERPLFAMSRRPAAPSVSDVFEAVHPGRASDMLKLLGTIRTNDTSLALFRHHEQGVLRRRRGDQIEGWRVERIDRERVHLTRAGEDEWLTLTKPPSIRTGGPPRPAFEKTAFAGDAALLQRSPD